MKRSSIVRTVGESFTTLGGGTPSTAKPEYWSGSIPWVTSADIDAAGDLHPRRTISEIAVQGSATNIVPAGAIVVATRVGLGKAGMTVVPTAFSQDCHGLVPKEVGLDPRFAMYQLQALVSGFRRVSRGTTIAGVTKKQLMALPFWLPSPDVQEALRLIVERRLSLLRNAYEILDRTMHSVQGYRAAVRQRATRQGFSDSAASTSSGDPWPSIPIGQVATLVVDGDHNPPKRVATGIPHLTAKNIRDSRVLTEGCTYISREDYIRGRRRYAAEEGDLLITCVGTIGRSAIVPPGLEFSADRNLAAIRVDRNVIGARFLKIVLDAPTW